jgi:hypothetical protein
MKNKKNITEPYIGQKIYVSTSLYLSHGMDDFEGGIATISKIEESSFLPKDSVNYLMVGIKERPGTLYNWKNLLEHQEEFKKRFGKKHAHPDPDNRPEFNMWD